VNFVSFVVEWSRDVARWFRCGLSVTGPFGCRCLTSHTVLRFHIPLIKPDVRFSRIRLSDKGSCFRPRKTTRPLLKAHQAQTLVQVVVGEV